MLLLFTFTAKTEIYYEVCFREMKCGFSHFLGVKFPSYKQPIIELAIILITDLLEVLITFSPRLIYLKIFKYLQSIKHLKVISYLTIH